MEAILKLDGIHKEFGQGDVLKGIDLQVGKAEFLTLLGPSGCGKTTTLRIIAGLENPSQGRVYLNGQDVTDLPPEKRNVNTVFQNYALFPHMNVEKNIAYGLKLRGVKKDIVAKKVKDALTLVQLEGYEKRMPAQLSGGQRQRVAIARAIVLEPSVLLLDEPLGALDLQLRRQMQVELKKLQQALGITFIYITHDQEEALNMSDRIGVMKDGLIEQLGTPQEIYEHPQTAFVAGFIGQTNVIPCEVVGNNEISIGGECAKVDTAGFEKGEHALLCLHTERVRYGGGEGISGKMVERHYAGGSQRAVIALKTGSEIIAISQSEKPVLPGDDVKVWWQPGMAALVKEARQ